MREAEGLISGRAPEPAAISPRLAERNGSNARNVPSHPSWRAQRAQIRGAQHILELTSPTSAPSGPHRQLQRTSTHHATIINSRGALAAARRTGRPF